MTSGLRLGTAALTTRGFGYEEMVEVARLIVKTLTNMGNEGIEEEVRQGGGRPFLRLPRTFGYGGLNGGLARLCGTWRIVL